jgi:phosphoserine aminotransferase
MKKHNFSAGPSILPQSVFEQAAQGVMNLNNSGLSILEISHRSETFVNIFEEARSLVKELLGLTDDYHVLFLSGGATSQFFMTAMNLLDTNETASYIDTGTWSTKAIKEAQLFGNVEMVASSKDKGYTYVPKQFKVSDNSKFLHLTTNNTIYGTQFHKMPDVGVPIIADMSSDIFSKRIDVSKYGVIYAGAQKNMGPAGTTLLIVRDDMLNKVKRTIPTVLDYRAHIKKGGLLNTPPVFPIYVSMLTLKWLKELGGVDVVHKRNKEKATLLYNEIDTNPCFVGKVDKADRSLMNITFLLKDSSLDDTFMKACTDNGISGVKGHRSVGGFRASVYNAMPKESVDVFVKVMKDFGLKYG